MDTHQKTNIEIHFNNGMDITPIVVFEGVEQLDKSKTFNKSTHEIEEIFSFVEEWENGGCDVFI
tara:strand:- start:2824 stop:3015 length:192 start_codon:yes stop_codon:yes gene_type:complete